MNRTERTELQELKDFYDTVVEMRGAQKQFFIANKRNNERLMLLSKSKDLEKEVDDFIKRKEPNLFNNGQK